MSELSFQQGISAQQEQRLEHRMTQQQVLAANLLQRNDMELRQELQARLEQNPVLEMEETREVLSGDLLDVGGEGDLGDYCAEKPEKEGDEDNGEPIDGYGPEQQEEDDEEDDEREEDEEEHEEGKEEEDYGENGDVTNWGEEDEKRRRFMMESLSTGQTLNEKLREQLQGSIADEELLEVCYDVIDRISDDGRLHGTDEELAADMGLPLAIVQKAVAIVQELDPPGIGGRDLRETLLLQLKRAGREDSLEGRICDKFLDELGENHLPQIAKALGCSVAEVQAAKDNIRALDGFPGKMLSGAEAHSIVPDITIFPDKKGGWEMRNNDIAFPVIRISPDYKEMSQQENLDKETKKWLREKISEGEQLIEALDYRKNTIERVAQQIVLAQQEFFRTGDEKDLKPLLMRTVAEQVGMDESTVSRAVKDKYMDTPFGIREFRQFFILPSKASSEGEELSAQSVQVRIRELIQAENPAHPLSDEKIVVLLQKEGLDVARRTVAKYRGILGIPSTSKRKRHGGV